jgi:hypothetical protein
MLRTMRMLLQRQLLAGIYDDVLDLEARAGRDGFIRSPWPCDLRGLDHPVRYFDGS